MNIQKAFLLFLIVPLLSFSTHKYYLSLTQIEYKSEARSLQIIINVFMDDIEIALNEKYQINLQLTSEEELKNNDIYFHNYLKEKLHLKINDVSREFNYLGKEYDGDLVYFYLEIENINEINSLEVVNTLLISNFPKQENLLKTKIHNKHQSLLLTAKKTTGLLKF